MTDESATNRTRYAARRQWLGRTLIPAVGILGVLLFFWTREHAWAAVMFMSVYHFQSSLLGICSGYGMIHLRVGCLLFGLLQLEFLIATGTPTFAWAAYALMPACLIAIGSRAMATWRRTVAVRIDKTELNASWPKLQFTVWGLMGVTMAVAMVLSLLRWGATSNSILTIIGLWYSSYLTLSLLAAWAILSPRSVLRRVTTWGAVFVAMGVCGELLFGGRVLMHSMVRNLMFMTTIQTWLLIASLSTLRWAGWRLAPKSCVVMAGEPSASLNVGFAIDDSRRNVVI